MDTGDLFQTVIAIVGLAVAGLIWAGQQKSQTNEHHRRLEAVEAALANQASTSALVARLEERINGLSVQLANQPLVIGTVVAGALKEVLSFQARRAA
jgi:uncharacterized protein HemX